MTDPKSLLAAAIAVRRAAYAPYSGFTVGAALLARDGRVFLGVNVENASYGLSMCAERGALSAAVANGARAFDAIAVAGPDGGATMPCGACRQALFEFAPNLRVIVAGTAGPQTSALGALLPDAFGPQRLREAGG